jgi:flagellar biosynthesis protein
LAERLLHLAKREGIPVHDAPDLANRLIWLGPGDFIPPEVYPVVAEILVQVMQLERERGGRNEDSGR